MSHGRRGLLQLGAALVAGRVLPGCASSHGREGSAGSKGALALTPEQEEGPFYLDHAKVRADLREGQAGVPLGLLVTVVDVRTGRSIPNSVLDIWSANAMGAYSGEEREGTAGETWLRGTQVTDASGRVAFTTIYPGLYRGRVNHIHVKVWTTEGASLASNGGLPAGHVCHTGQLFFEQAINDAVRAIAPYAANPTERRTDADDDIFTHEGGREAMLALTGSPAAGFAANVQLRVDPSVTRVQDRRPPPFGFPPGGPGPGGPPPGGPWLPPNGRP